MTSSQQSLRGQTALVTGATSGIGRATAIALAREGAEVIAHGRDARRGEQVVAEITGALGKARFVAADLSDPIGIRHIADEAAQAGTSVADPRSGGSPARTEDRAAVEAAVRPITPSPDAEPRRQSHDDRVHP